MAQFIIDAKTIHGNKYDYSESKYVNSSTKISIICPIHGIFKQTPSNHLNGHGCPKCANKYSRTTKEWIELAKTIHGDKYDYSKSEYTNIHTKVSIICPKHGEFQMLPPSHIKGCGCKECAKEELSKKYSFNTKQFIELAKKVHGNKYDYSKVNYINSHEDVNITCRKHGEFIQKAYMHLSGNGCPRCNASHLETDMRNALEANDIEYIDHCNKRTLEWIGLQHLDFYLPKYNIAIECQGEQHYKPIECFGGQHEFENNLRRDERKRVLCEDNGVTLLYYTTTEDVTNNGATFKDANELIEHILEKKALV